MMLAGSGTIRPARARAGSRPGSGAAAITVPRPRAAATARPSEPPTTTSPLGPPRPTAATPPDPPPDPPEPGPPEPEPRPDPAPPAFDPGAQRDRRRGGRAGASRPSSRSRPRGGDHRGVPKRIPLPRRRPFAPEPAASRRRERCQGDPDTGRRLHRTGGGNDSTALDPAGSRLPHRPVPREGLDDGRRPSGSATLPYRPVDERGLGVPQRRPRAASRGPGRSALDGAVAQPERVRDLVVAAAPQNAVLSIILGAGVPGEMPDRQARHGRRAAARVVLLAPPACPPSSTSKRVVYRTAEWAIATSWTIRSQRCPGRHAPRSRGWRVPPTPASEPAAGTSGARLRWAQPPAIPSSAFR